MNSNAVELDCCRRRRRVHLPTKSTPCRWLVGLCDGFHAYGYWCVLIKDPCCQWLLMFDTLFASIASMSMVKRDDFCETIDGRIVNR
jgi:hypothetical protein